MRSSHSSHSDFGHGAQGPAGDQTSPDLLAQMGYETRDIALNTLMRWLIFLAVFIAVMIAVGFITYKVFVPNWVEAARTAPYQYVRKLPPYPQVQADPRRDMMEYREAEDAAVRGLAAAGSGPNQKVGLPLDVAIQQVATEQGISGIRGDAVKPQSQSYPGSGNYGGKGQPKSDNDGTDDMTDTSATHGQTANAPQAGGTGEAQGEASPTAESGGTSQPASNPPGAAFRQDH